ncbi:MAG: AEC family transporter [Clostridium sp.]|jgi:predicted permease|uniref:AEC family transporter n=1 Tax=Clostridium sp. TaxID=1506 RepID=UPI0025C2AE18|nr:AEC family transporter [Clostridium sp.]MCH3965119.1 AEC family transporter [Clostridium sp.]MCI1714340.1 AEC family transporter [Clostridium sp.]MCI1798602.1 AEC family transporter [Clostridium sp.]MCI1812667.1 AEC family transporter [Clostridium sp.]MCI1869411.1 AEC family transporter [Clostridium sp.]
MENVNNQFILFLLIIGLGYIFKRLNIIKESDGDGVSRIIFNITLPALIISTFNTMKLDISLIFLAVISLLFGILMCIIAIPVFKNEGKKSRGAFSMMLPGFNVGLFAYPVVEALWGYSGLKYFGMFDMGNSITMFVTCYIIANCFSANDKPVNIRITARKLLTSIPLMCYAITLIINICGLHYPEPVVNICKILEKGNMPLSLLLLGICLNFNIDKTYRKNILKVLSIRYICGLAIGILFFTILPFDKLFKYTVLIGLTLPVGMAVIPYAVEFNYDKRLVGTVCNISLILSFILIWVIVNVL